jgi:rhodanese-related sulfurtransferase
VNPAPKIIDSMSLRERLDRGEPVQLIDVRHDEEVAICRVPGALHIPMDAIQDRIGELDPKAPTVVYCHHGIRSHMVATYLLQQGFADVSNLKGGIDHYAAAADPTLARY